MGDRAGHRRRHRYRFAVDADGSGRVGADFDLLRGQQCQSRGPSAAEQADRLPDVRTLTPITPSMPR